jgi:DNA-binding HxlR family transcriptional regulator
VSHTPVADTDVRQTEIGATDIGEHVAAEAVAGLQICDAGVARAFDFLGKRWNGVILGALSKGALGFADLRRGVGSITDSVLSDRLAELTRAGLVQRTVTDTRPPGVVYQLSSTGTELLPILHQLGQWASTHLPLRDC